MAQVTFLKYSVGAYGQAHVGDVKEVPDDIVEQLEAQGSAVKGNKKVTESLQSKVAAKVEEHKAMPGAPENKAIQPADNKLVPKK